MGLGKTIQSLAFLIHVKVRHVIFWYCRSRVGEGGGGEGFLTRCVSRPLGTLYQRRLKPDLHCQSFCDHSRNFAKVSFAKLSLEGFVF